MPKTKFHPAVMVGTILIINSSPEILKKTMRDLNEKGYSVLTASDRKEASVILKRAENEIGLILLDPVLDSLSSGLKLAEEINQIHELPLLIYTDHSDDDLIAALDEITHYGIVLISTGSAILLSSILQISRAIEKSRKLRPVEDTMTRLINRINESNRAGDESEYSRILQKLEDAIIVVDNRNLIIEANKKAAEVLRIPHERLTSHKSIHDLIPPGWELIREDFSKISRENSTAAILNNPEKTSFQGVFGLKRPGKKTFWLSIISQPIHSSNKKELKGIVHSFYEISEEIKMKQRNDRWANIFRNAEWGIVVGEAESGTLDQMNPAYAKMHGYSIDELLGKPVTDVFAPEERESVPKHMSLAHKKGHHRFESMHLRKDGTRFPALMDITTIKNDLGIPQYRAVSVLDITERKKQEQTLRDSLIEKETLLDELKKAGDYSEALFNNSPIAIYSLDENSCVVNFNRKAEEITGYDKKELLGKKISFLTENLQSQESVGREYKIKTKSDKDKIIEKYSAVLRDKNGKQTGLIESFIDITSWKELDEFRSDIQRIIRHDLKTPLNSIIGFPQMMLTDESISDEYREYLMIILTSGKNMLNLINASLNMYKLEAGSYKYEMTDVNIISVLNQINTELREIRQRKKSSINLLCNSEKLKPDEKIIIETEKSLFSMILTNIIKNALEASPKGSPVTVSIEKGDKLIISVHNSGAIPEEIRDKFFEKYVTSGKRNGNGLGTYSARVMANAIEAELYFTTSEQDGTTLFLKF